MPDEFDGEHAARRSDGVKIEENYYDLGGRKKRFFDRNQLERLFKTWDMCHIDEYSLDRF